ncbi:TPA: CHAD domain-containing protein [Pseudomonas aeruginosa]|nr:CHAD domain-containing protein [Pseudomonas aeruginosa]
MPANSTDFLIARLIGLQVDYLHAAQCIESASDGEALHDLRITLRGVRSLLRPLRQRPELAVLDQAAAALLTSTSGLRDAQVLAQELDRLGWQAEASRRRAHVDQCVRLCLRKPIAKRVLGELERWPAAFRKIRSGSDLKHIRKLVRRRAKRDLEQLREVLEQSHDSPRDWHAIRLRIKRVRYLCESYANWIRPDDALLDDLKHAQSNLGNEHDLRLRCASSDKDRPLRPLINGWLSARSEAQHEVQTVLAALLERLTTSRKEKKHVPPLKPVKVDVCSSAAGRQPGAMRLPPFDRDQIHPNLPAYK